MQTSMENEFGLKLEPQFDTLVIFDWDDTLLASTWLAENKCDLLSTIPMEENIANELQKLEKSICELFDMAMKVAKCVIITNAEENWVQLSCKKFLPKVADYFDRLTIISARSTYREAPPGTPLLWKFFSVAKYLTYLTNNGMEIKNIISFGDNCIDHQAIKKVIFCAFKSTNVKCVKFAERPLCSNLTMELNVVRNSYNKIYNYKGNMDLFLSILIA